MALPFGAAAVQVTRICPAPVTALDAGVVIDVLPGGCGASGTPGGESMGGRASGGMNASGSGASGGTNASGGGASGGTNASGGGASGGGASGVVAARCAPAAIHGR